jgi:putative transposase
VTKKKELIEKRNIDKPLSWYLEAIGLSKKGWYHHQNKKDDDTTIAEIRKVLIDIPYYGYRRITKELKAQNMQHNHKKILRIMKENNLTQKSKKKAQPHTTNSNHTLLVYPNTIKDLTVDVAGIVWVADITYVWLGTHWGYVAIVLDQGSRKVLGWSISTSLHRQLCIDAIMMALETNKAPEYHHSDRGVQYCSHDYIGILKKHGITPSMADVGVSVDNPHAESFNRSLKVEEVYLNAYESFEEARDSIKLYLECYNTKRLHSSLGYVSPVTFELNYQSLLN